MAYLFIRSCIIKSNGHEFSLSNAQRFGEKILFFLGETGVWVQAHKKLEVNGHGGEN
jgi:hypothetical protein